MWLPKKSKYVYTSRIIAVCKIVFVSKLAIYTIDTMLSWLKICSKA